MEFHYDQIENDVLIVAADGGLNAQTADVFVRDIEKLVEAGLRKIIVDCEKLAYVSSYGLGVLIRLHKRLTMRGGDVKICNVHGIVPQVLEATRLAQWFDIYPDLNQAKLAFRPRKLPTE
jgi:anti-sigma B factor antagonist